MKKIKSIISVLLSLIIVSVFATSLVSSATTPASKTINTQMEAQLMDYYCGVASVQSVLWNEYQKKSFVTRAAYLATISNQFIVSGQITQKSGYNVNANKQTPWFTGYDNNQASDINYNPVCKTLNKMSDNNWGILGRYTKTGDFKDASVRNAIVNSINKGHCVAANGASTGITYTVKVNNKAVTYPTTNGHWVVVKGYENGGNTLIIADPAANSKALGSSWKVLTPTYKVSISEFYKFIGNGSHGIVYHK